MPVNRKEIPRKYGNMEEINIEYLDSSSSYLFYGAVRIKFNGRSVQCSRYLLRKKQVKCTICGIKCISGSSFRVIELSCTYCHYTKLSLSNVGIFTVFTIFIRGTFSVLIFTESCIYGHISSLNFV